MCVQVRALVQVGGPCVGTAFTWGTKAGGAGGLCLCVCAGGRVVSLSRAYAGLTSPSTTAFDLCMRESGGGEQLRLWPTYPLMSSTLTTLCTLTCLLRTHHSWSKAARYLAVCTHSRVRPGKPSHGRPHARKRACMQAHASMRTRGRQQ